MRIEVKNLIKKFNSSLAVNNVSFIVEKNKTVGLLGPNGCGKTTSIGMMLGLIKPTSGDVLINESNINKVNNHELLSEINFASPYIELPKKLTVKQNLEVYALAPLPILFSYKSEKSLCGTAASAMRGCSWMRRASTPLTGARASCRCNLATLCPCKTRACPRTASRARTTPSPRRASSLKTRCQPNRRLPSSAIHFTTTASGRCASLALAPLPLVFSYKSEKSLCGAGAASELAQQPQL